MAISASSPEQKCVGILGGTFNPIHLAHLRLAIEARERLDLDAIRLIPAARPAHRDAPEVSAEHRLAMVRLATDGVPGLGVDDRELRRPGTSYMVDTLTDLRAELGQRPLALLMGGDAFLDLHTWHQWRRLLTLTHLVVIRRPGASRAWPAELAELARHETPRAETLHATTAGAIWFADDWPTTTLSASYVREQAQAGRDLRFLVPEPVRHYIETHGLYPSH